MAYFPTPLITNGYCSVNSDLKAENGFAIKSTDKKIITLSNTFQMATFPVLTHDQNEESLRLRLNMQQASQSYKLLRHTRESRFSDVQNAHKELNTAQKKLSDYTESLIADQETTTLAVFESELGHIGFAISFYQAASLAPLSHSHVIEMNHADWRRPSIKTANPLDTLKAAQRHNKMKMRVQS